MTFKHKDATNHGIDIAKGRVDDLDKEVIRFATNYKGRKVAIDLGSGQSRLSLILTLLGFDVYCYDIKNHQKYFATLDSLAQEVGVVGKLHFIKSDIATLTHTDLPNDIVIAVSQRTLHHLPYADAKSILEKVASKMIIDGKMFLSISSLKSKFVGSQGSYDCADSPVQNRFCEVGELGKSTYSITGPVCLYKKQEVVDMLEEAGLEAEKLSESAFGNFKIIAKKKVI